ncbi:UNVERIFIED_CONTAM: protein TPLATE [Sesamum angustifolium]|uniref:Protein TPLATE n=1 Tax=Sesamum angustifolium TaxID=2727405 RepID=A0AAW2NKX9_9LAMI
MEAEMHVLQMIQEGEIHATINQKDRMVRFLEDPEQCKTCEMIECIDLSMQRMMMLSKKLRAMSEVKLCDPSYYLGKVGKERQRYEYDDFDTVPSKLTVPKPLHHRQPQLRASSISPPINQHYGLAAGRFNICRRDRRRPCFCRLQKARLRPHSLDSAYGRSVGTVCTGIRNDLDFPDPDVTAAAVSILAAIPSYRLGKLINDCNKEISACFDSASDNLRFSITETLGCSLARDDLVTLCENNINLLDRVSNWWSRIAQNMLDKSDAVSKVAFEAIGKLFQEFESKRMSRLAGDKLVDTENSLAIRSNWITSMVDFVWKKRNALMSRSLVLPVESFRATVYPLVYAVKAVACGSIEVIKKLSMSSKGGSAGTPSDSGNAERFVGVSDVVSHLAPFLASSLDPALIFEVGINMLYLADVPGGKPEWASTSIIAILTLWDRQEYSSARESIVRAVVTNLHLLDLSMQVSLFKRLLLMVRNLRAESDRMHALACICRTALCVDLFAKESVRRGQKPLAGTDIASLFEDARVKDDLNSVTSKSLFREELVAMLVESCFQLSLPLPEQKSSGMESRVIGALAYGTGYGALNWTEPALEVVEVCRPCVKWDCDGRTYAIDCYLKLLVRLCRIYDTRGGVKRVKDGASQDQILNETRLQNLQRELVNDLREVNTPRICARLIWAISEHIDLEGLDPLLADDPEDPLNIIVSNIHKVLFNVDSSASTTNRPQDVQVVLLCAQRLGSRNARAGHLLTKELEEFRTHPSADSVNRHQCRLILQRMKYVSSHPDDKWAGVSEARGDYPFSHHKLTVQFYDASAAQDRKLEGLIHKAILELWRPDPNELAQLLTKGIDSNLIKVPPNAFTLSGSSDPCYIEGYHLTDPNDGRITLHLKVLNLTEIELNRVDIRVGLSGGLYFMDGSPQAVRQLRGLNSQEPVLCSVTVGVSHFERCALWVQVLYYGVPADYEGTYPEEDPQIIRQKKGSKHEIGEPVILRCQPYKIPLTELLLPHKISPVEYFRLWPSLPAVVECTGTYTYEGSGFKATAAQQYGESPFLSGLKSLSSKPFHKVCSHIIRTVAGFQLCYAAKTWYGGFVGMMIFGASEVSRNVDLGDETTTMICKFVVRASDASITKEIGSDLQGWMDDLTDGTIEYMPEDEVKAAAAERLRTSMERIALLKAARPRPKTPKSDDEEEKEEEQDEDEQDTENKENEEGDGKTKGPSTLFKLTAEEVEHRALQVAVLQEWHMLCKDRSTKVN